MKEKEKKAKKDTIYKVLSLVCLLISIIYLGYTIILNNSIINNIDKLSIPLLTLILSIILFIEVLKNKEIVKICSVFSIILIFFMVFNVASASKIIKLPEEKKLGTYENISYKTFSEWANKNNIKVNIEYDYSDTIELGNIIRLNLGADTLVKEIKEITAIVSDGPNYDKLIIIPSMLGWNVDDVVKYINENFLTNVVINFEASSDEKDTIINQDKNGEIRRNQELVLTASLGTEEDILENINMIDLTNKSLFDATLWLKRNNIKYTTTYEFSSKIKRNTVLSQSIAKDTEININDTEVSLIISKGKAIKMIDLTKMTVEEITKWITDNNLKILFNEIYDEKKETGKVISQDIEINTEIEINTLITVTISRGQIKMEEFNSLYDFKDWANKYGVKYNESYEFSNTISKGNVISYSYNVGDIIDPNGIIYVKISLGKAISIPSFIGKTKSQAQSTCTSLGIRCSFTSGAFTTYVKDTVYSQSRNVGYTVSSGSTITLTLSKGIPQKWQLAIGPWELQNDADSTIKSLTSAFADRYPGVNFNFVKKGDNTLRPGLVKIDSPTKKGDWISQGETYTIWIVQ